MTAIDELKIEKLARDLCEADGHMWGDNLNPIEPGSPMLTSIGVSGREQYRQQARARLADKRAS